MSFLAIKNNPFPEDGGPWNGAGARAEGAAMEAIRVATETLKDAIVERAGSLDRWDDELVSNIGVVRDSRGMPRVGVPNDPEIERRALEAEYGTEEHKPQALMRTTQKRARAGAEEALRQTLREGLFGGGGG